MRRLTFISWIKIFILRTGTYKWFQEKILRRIKKFEFYRVRFLNGPIINLPYDKIKEDVDYLAIGQGYIDFLLEHGVDIKLMPNDIVIDLGAHCGLFSIPLYQKYNCTVYAVEASPMNYFSLKDATKANGFNNFNLYNYCIADVTGEIEFSTGRSSTTGSVLNLNTFKVINGTRQLFSSKGKIIKVASVTLKDFLNNVKLEREKIKILKIDIEGAEYFLFKDNFLASLQAPLIIIEAHPTEVGMPADVESYFKHTNYKILKRVIGNGCVEYFMIKN